MVICGAGSGNGGQQCGAGIDVFFAESGVGGGWPTLPLFFLSLTKPGVPYPLRSKRVG